MLVALPSTALPVVNIEARRSHRAKLCTLYCTSVPSRIVPRSVPTLLPQHFVRMLTHSFATSRFLYSLGSQSLTRSSLRLKTLRISQIFQTISGFPVHHGNLRQTNIKLRRFNLFHFCAEKSTATPLAWTFKSCPLGSPLAFNFTIC